jgi:hypothetical protein
MIHMHYTELPTDLAFAVKVAAAFADVSPSKWIHLMVQRAVEAECDTNPLFRAIVDHKP